MSTYVISDIHGHYQEFVNLLEKINFSKTDKLILLGDYIDRGPENMKVIFHIIKLKREGYDVIALTGNHEEEFLSYVKKHPSLESLLGNYMDYSLSSANGVLKSLQEFYELSDKDKIMVKHFIHTLPLYHIHGEFFCVHAGVNPDKPLDQHYPVDFLWIREPFLENPVSIPYTVVFGHTPTPIITSSKRAEVVFLDGKIGIDCACCFSRVEHSSLAALRLEDLEVFYHETIKEDSNDQE